ncbi:MAG: MarR family transcriptional regulator [Verrucomicrobia bacterium]|nr:MarR family transcriptional regulator [Verrucomicrobiota bacterium]MCG2681796.1 MarR family transcriptional regulator [Kiritimatiellia bacterium]MBU4247277.1 MarR family transcriptional regulator [Verrucomicrobiota bacterium]MBU4289893.1 MarR family transcriptional regulator [Verrucomicrobiota bacterium]MBU4427963.1 MarR family transcriptional regulator [Verrucomicrobiota bacterium]
MFTNKSNFSFPTQSQEEPAQLSSQSLDALVVHNILRTANQLSPFLNHKLRELDLTNTQINVLLLLHESAHEELNLSLISRHLLVTKANVTGLIDRLERKGLVKRESVADRRVTIVRLTSEGRMLIDQILPHHERNLAELTQGLDQAQKETLVKLLVQFRQKFRDNHLHKRESSTPVPPG